MKAFKANPEGAFLPSYPFNIYIVYMAISTEEISYQHASTVYSNLAIIHLIT